MKPPRLAHAIVRRVLPADVRADVSGDLDEVFARNVREHGVAFARRQYRRTAWSFARHFLVERIRDRRHSLAGLRMSLLDFKLGARMLTRYPGLTFVGGLAMAFAIAIGAGVFAFLSHFLAPTLPLPAGDRIVSIWMWNAASNSVEREASYDFARWRIGLRTLEDVGAHRVLQRNLIFDSGLAEPVSLAEMTASVFRMTRVPPALGRSLTETDEQVGAPDVIVLGYELWQRRFDGDPGVIGRTVGIGRVTATVVGVMPGSYAFPMAQEAWMPLRLTEARPLQGPPILLSARLAPGATIEQARNELSAMVTQTAAEPPSSRELLRANVLPYADAMMDLGTAERSVLMSVNLFIGMLLVLISGNVALLMFARATTREGEIVVRSALGASRGRIVMQFLSEALVLGGVAAAVGLVAAAVGLRWGMQIFRIENGGEPLPFWFHDRLGAWSLAYALGLMLLSAVIAGVVPALKVTRGLQSRLRQAAAGGGGLRFGGIWTVVIVAQIAVTVVFPVTAFFVKRDAVQIEAIDVGFPTSQFLTARIEMDRDPGAPTPAADGSQRLASRLRAASARMKERLVEEPGITKVTFAERLPLMYHPYRLIEVDEGGAASAEPDWAGYRVSAAGVDNGFFAAVDAPILSGRGFTPADFESGHRVVIVNQSFVRRVLGDRNPIGRRVRYAEMEEWDDPRPASAPVLPWFEIIGVVRDLGMAVEPDPKVAGLYYPLTSNDVQSMRVALRVTGDPMTFAPALRRIAWDTDPALRLYDIQPLDQVTRSALLAIGFWFRLVLGVSGVALLLSLAGIYAVMSFTVSRRTREIGIRVALGSARGRVILTILRRPLAQVALGIAAGGVLATWLTMMIYEGSLSFGQVMLVGGYLALMTVVCLLACVVPTWRALGIEPTEALRTEG